jgi:L-lactate utilization protein LutB
VIHDFKKIQDHLIAEIDRRKDERRRIEMLRKLADSSAKLRLQNEERYALSEMRKRVRATKEYSINNLSELTKISMENFEKNGIIAYFAKTKEEVLNNLLKICDEDFLIASSADVMIETGAEDKLRERGISIFHTDFGQMLYNLMPGEVASNKSFPVIHVPPEIAAEKLSASLGVTLRPDAGEIVRAARDHALKFVAKANIGISGANSISADGSIFLVHNQGNINFVASRLRKHITVTGIEKIVPSLSDALNVVTLQSIYQTGRTARHMNIISGPTRSIDIAGLPVKGVYGPEEVHVILVDDWRTKALKEGFGEALYCIRCLHCTEVCPVCDRVGLLFSYLERYPFPARGAVTAAFCEGIYSAFKSGLFMCTLCGACKRECPLQIDTPAMVERLRMMAAEHGIIPERLIDIERKIVESGNVFGAHT